MNINKISYRDSSHIYWFSKKIRTRANVAIQTVIFSQSLFFAALFWLITSSETSAIYGFMLGSLSTIAWVFFQCNKKRCLQNIRLIKKADIYYVFSAFPRSISSFGVMIIMVFYWTTMV